MMSPNVRRLALDPAPLYQNGAGLFIWLIVGMITTVWGTGHGSPNLMMAFSGSIVTTNYLTKIKTWQLLPVSRKELGQAQWWHLLGRPFVIVFVMTASVFGVEMTFGWLRVSVLDFFAYLSGLVTLIFLMGSTLPIATVLGRAFQATGYYIGLLVTFLPALALGFHWSDREAFSGMRSEMLLGGALSLLLAALSYALSAVLPLAEQKAPSGQKDAKANNETPKLVQQAERMAGPRHHGRLSVLLNLYWNWMKIPLVGLVTGSALIAFSHMGFLTNTLNLFWLIQLLPLSATFVATIVTPMISQRALAFLPLSALQRTLALQSISPLLQAPLTGLMVMAVVILHPEVVTHDWLVTIGFILLGGLAFGSIALPLSLRFTQKGPAIVIAVLGIPLGIAGGVFGALSSGAREIIGFQLQDAAHLFLGLCVALLLAGWIWTYFELALGRAAYRQRLAALATWRGIAR